MAAKIAMLFACLLVLSGCTVSGEGFDLIMKREGVTKSRQTGFKFMGCDRQFARTGFAGIKNNEYVEGVICGGHYYYVKYTY